MPAVITARAGKAVGKNAALQVTKGLRDVGGRRVVADLPVERTGAGEPKPCLKMFGHRAVQQGLLGAAGVVELWLGRWFSPTGRVKARMLLRMAPCGRLAICALLAPSLARSPTSSPACMLPRVPCWQGFVPARVFIDLGANVVVLDVARTFWEKAAILHAEHYRAEHLPVRDRFARHYSDFAALWQQDQSWRGWTDLICWPMWPCTRAVTSLAAGHTTKRPRPAG